MAFGRRKDKGGSEPKSAEPEVVETPVEFDSDVEEDLQGPFDIEDFDDPAAAEAARLDLGSVLIPMPAGAQVQVELSQAGVPSAVWLVTPNGRFNIAAYAAPKSPGLWREVATELASALQRDSASVSIVDGPWGREVVGSAAGAVRFIGVDGYRWMVRCVINGRHDTIGALTDQARAALADTVIRRGDTPMPVRTPLPVRLPEPMAEQLRAAAAQQAAAQQAAADQQAAVQQAAMEQQAGMLGLLGGGGAPPEPTARRSAEGSAMQQLRTITGG